MGLFRPSTPICEVCFGPFADRRLPAFSSQEAAFRDAPVCHHNLYKITFVESLSGSRSCGLTAELLGTEAEEFSAELDFGAFSEMQRVFNVDAEVADRALDFGVAKQNLHGAQIAGLLVDDGRLGAAQRMRPVVLWTQADPDYPLIDEARILPGADVIGVIDPAGKHEIVKRPASTFEPGKNAAASRFKELELNRPAGFLLDDDCP